MEVDNRLRRGHVLECEEAFLATVSTFLHAAKRQFDTAAGSEVVDEDLSAIHSLGHTLLTIAVAGPDRADQAVVCGVRQFHSIIFILEWNRRRFESQWLLGQASVVW